MCKGIMQHQKKIMSFQKFGGGRILFPSSTLFFKLMSTILTRPNFIFLYVCIQHMIGMMQNYTYVYVHMEFSFKDSL